MKLDFEVRTCPCKGRFTSASNGGSWAGLQVLHQVPASALPASASRDLLFLSLGWEEEKFAGWKRALWQVD